MKVHLNELDELRLKQDKMMNDFLMSRDWFDVALASTDNKQKKAREEEKTIEEEDVRKTH